jgi:hypothetical protein
MNTRPLDKFARSARRQLHEQVAARLERVLRTDSAELREHAPALQKLKDEIKATSQAAVVERVAYTWFNRFCALRFMDVNHYTRIGIVSPVDGQFQPEILAEAKMGHVDEELVPDKRRRQILDLLGGSAPSRDPQGEAYRLLVVAACNSYHRAMPYLFESIADYTELLMPDDLLSGNSILAYTREALTPDACQDVEVIGWLYQFYIAEKKDEVFAALKQGSKISEQDIPSVTQLFTPDWIVRFLVDNSLGRLWMLSRPQSRLIERMSYYIRPDQTQAEYLRVASPEDLRVGDSAVGAAHMLTYAFDLLYAIYEEEGYNPPDIPRLILTQNLFGMEIDERAGALAAFALTMKACAKDRRFLKRGVRPNICVLHSIFLTETELASAPWRQQMAKNLIDLPMLDALTADLHKMEQAGLVGSLLRPQLTLQQIADVRARIGAADTLFAHGLNERVLDALDQLEFLARHHHVVVANPPYMGGKGMNAELSDFAQSEYPDSKADMFAMFIERNLDLAKQGGLVAMITMQSWMFLSSYEKLRAKLLDQQTLLTMAHLGAKAFDSIGGEVVSTTAFVIERVHRPEYKGSYVRLVDGNSEAEKEAALRTALASPLHRASAADFKKIPGAPIAYWVSERIFAIFRDEQSLGNKTLARQGLATGDNDLFARLWHEVPLIDICFHAKSCEETFNLAAKWFPYNKGGEFRKWFGNILYVVDWQNDGQRIRNFRDGNGKLRSRPQNTRCYFREGITWSDVTSGELSCRYLPSGNIYDISGHSAFPVGDHDLYGILAYLNTRFCMRLAKVLNPTLHFQIGDYSNLPYPSRFISECVAIAAKRNVEIGQTRLGFLRNLLGLHHPAPAAARAPPGHAGRHLRQPAPPLAGDDRRDAAAGEENNRIFIDAYGLQDELTPDVPLHEITLTCNPHYRYSAGKSDAEYEAMLLADTMR